MGDDELVRNLGGALLRGGADSVILPRVAVELFSHVPFATKLHKGLVEGLGAAEALRRARESVSNDPLERYFAGLFQLYGLGSPRRGH